MTMSCSPGSIGWVARAPRLSIYGYIFILELFKRRRTYDFSPSDYLVWAEVRFGIKLRRLSHHLTGVLQILGYNRLVNALGISKAGKRLLKVFGILK